MPGESSCHAGCRVGRHRAWPTADAHAEIVSETDHTQNVRSNRGLTLTPSHEQASSKSLVAEKRSPEMPSVGGLASCDPKMLASVIYKRYALAVWFSANAG